ncbi:MAG TPA: penicillin-binding protein 2 [Candidatus Saccharimonadales bacterium]|nr:penicillin-binding protein 2 [Candidatus Saccharimonadales bacterium]
MTQDYRHRKGYKDYVRSQVLDRRISLLAVLTAVALSFYLMMLWYLQVVEADRYTALAEQNRVRRVNVRAPRGAILDRNGEILARNRVSFSIRINREEAKDLDADIEAVAKVLDTGEREIRDRFSHAAARAPRFEPILVAEDVPLGAVAWLEAHRAEYPGVSIDVENLRYYEGGASGAHLLGYVGEVSAGELASGRLEGAASGDIVGKSGLEKYLDSQLRGENGYRRIVVNNVGREVGGLSGGVPAQPGSNVRSSIDRELQRTLDLAFGSHRGAGVFMDPWTGEILALTSRPGYDPNLFAKRFTRSVWRALVTDPRHPLQDRAIQSAYSPGSTFKLLEAVAALEEGVVTPDTRFFCGGSAKFHGRTFHCYNLGGHGWVDLHDALVKSCNIYFYNLADRLGMDRIAEYARRFGLGTRTGIPMASENPGLVPDEEWKKRTTGERWYPSETISVGIGQGPLLVTPLQMAVMVSAIATDGRIPVPTLIRVSGSEGERAAAVGQRKGPPIPKAYLDVVRKAMWGVVHQGGTRWRGEISGFDVCGKTGTAQVTSASTGVTDEKDLPPELRDHSWFVGFAPLENPEIAFAVIVEHGGHGGATAVPLVKEALEAYFGHRPVKPESPQQASGSEEGARHDSAGDARVF